MRKKRIIKDYEILRGLHKKKVIEQVKSFDPKKKSMEHLAVSFKGPKNTPYAGGKYKLEIKYGANYPMRPPYVRLHTPIWHPNFWPNPKEYPGKRNICLALVDNELVGKPNGWSPSKNIGTVVHSILAMLNIEGAFVNPKDVFNKDAAIEFLNKKKNFVKKAKGVNKKYANSYW
ncbi:MAG: ubiquitin-conjugating enzyme E2 variant [Candidatus Kariarchaeaceae archaeon]|jgi:ubiquitin-protein ligase